MEYSPRQLSSKLQEIGISVSNSTILRKCHEGKIVHRKAYRLFSTEYAILIPESELQKIIEQYKGAAS